jgi:hypothetical protein
MEHRDGRQSAEGALYARIIVGWHTRTGIEELQRRFGREFGQGQDDWLVRYRHVVAGFQERNFSDPSVQLAIAREQIAGSMEWASGATVPEELWEFEGTQPSLGELARKLKELALQAQDEELGVEGRILVRYSGYEELLVKAREVYARTTRADVQGGGGTSFLLSCSLERSDRREYGEIVLLSPERLGVSRAPQGRAGDFLEQLAGLELEILDVMGSSPS